MFLDRRLQLRVRGRPLIIMSIISGMMIIKFISSIITIVTNMISSNMMATNKHNRSHNNTYNMNTAYTYNTLCTMLILTCNTYTDKATDNHTNSPNHNNNNNNI